MAIKMVFFCVCACVCVRTRECTCVCLSVVSSQYFVCPTRTLAWWITGAKINLLQQSCCPALSEKHLVVTLPMDTKRNPDHVTPALIIPSLSSNTCQSRHSVITLHGLYYLTYHGAGIGFSSPEQALGL